MADNKRRDKPDRRRSQQDHMLRNMPGIEPGPPTWRETGIEYFYEAGTLLVHDHHAEHAHRLLSDRGMREREDAQPYGGAVVSGVRRMSLGSGVNAVEAARLLRDGEPGSRRNSKGLGHGAVSINHLVHIAGDAGICPAHEPEPVPAGTPLWPAPTLDAFAGTGVRIVVIDTGVDAATVARHPFLAGVTGDPDQAVGTQNPPQLDRYAGHGTFIAGLIRSVAPGAEVIVRAFANQSGAALESELAPKLAEVLQHDQPDVISFSAGSRTWDGAGLMSLSTFNETQLRHHKGVVLVAAAGNDGDRGQFWPAAAPFAVSSGSLNRTLDARAEFSNYGGWVDVYSPGEDLIGVFPLGRYQYGEGEFEHRQPPRIEEFTGLARWSGTSFSTPILAGMIAARMSHTGENGTTAAAALVRVAQGAARPGVGAMLLP